MRTSVHGILVMVYIVMAIPCLMRTSVHVSMRMPAHTGTTGISSAHVQVHKGEHISIHKWTNYEFITSYVLIYNCRCGMSKALKAYIVMAYIVWPI